VVFSVIIGFESGFTGFIGLKLTSLMGGGIVLMEMNTFYVLFAAAIIPAAKSPEIKASFYNNLSNQTKGVMVNPRNPVNPDSNNWLQRAPSKPMSNAKKSSKSCKS
jgi:hypothetical protein